jgi:hypothetical protein
MNNLFDTANYPDAEPEELTAGDRWAWTRSDITDAYATTLYTLKYRLSPMDASRAEWTIEASKVSSAHVVELSQATTEAYPSTYCSWRAIVVRDSDEEEVTVDQGHVEIHPALGATAGTQQSWVYQTLAAIRAVLKETASKEQSEYSIAGRSLVRRTPGELLELEREFTKRWETEKAGVERKAGRSAGSRVLAKMGA